MLKINGVAIATPKAFEVTISDVYKRQECSTLLKAVKDVFFQVTYPDPELGVVTKTMYVGDRTSPAYSAINGVVKWNGVKFNLVER